MDIERLKELQGLVALNTWMSERAKKELLTIIDEAIAAQSDKHPMAGTDPDADDWGNGYSRGYADGLQICQSATSEEVAEAISWVTNTRHRNQYMSGDWTAPMYNHINRTIQDTIIAALQAYQPTTRKDRTVEEVAEAIKQKIITDAMDYLNKNMKQPFIERESELNDV